MSGRAITKWILAALALALALLVTTTATSGALSGDTALASVVRGGRLYDTWYKEIGEPPPTVAHPAYPPDRALADSPDINWRCAECHGWDYRGRDGAYAKGSHFTGIKGIRMMAGAAPADIVAILKDGRHGYGGLMADQDFADLALFVSRGQIDMDVYIDRESGAAKENNLRPAAHYKTICANCHGMDGLTLRTMPPLVDVARANPWKALHIILNGHPGENMPALRALDMSILIDVLAYVQTLPTEK